jgi:hypothetical protein
VLRNFYDPSKHADYPDLLSFFAGVTQEEVAAFAARTFAPEREVTTLIGVQPMSQRMLAAAALVLVFLTIRGLAWTFTRLVTMPKILHVVRFRIPVLVQVGAAVLIGGIGLIVGRLIVFVVQSLALAFVVTIDDYGVQLWFYGATLIVVAGLSVLFLSRVPRKIIVFPDHLRIKFLAYRSRILEPDDFLELSTRRGHQVWFRNDLFRCVPLSLGLAGPGIYLRPINGRAYFFRPKDTEELVDVLGGWRGASVSAAAVRKKPKDSFRDPFQEAMDTSDWISSMVPDQLPEDDEPSGSIDRDLLLGYAEASVNRGMDEDEIKYLLGDAYKRDVKKKF